MNLCFADFTKWDYNVDAPTIKPLGGSQSALCYLATELTKAGNNVTTLTGTTKPGVVRGVECMHDDNCNQYFFAYSKFDAVIVLNGAGYSKLRDIVPSSTRLVLWTHHEPIQPAMRKLTDKDVADRWDNIVCVSDWQRQSYVDEFKLAPERITVMRNAIAPSFERLFLSADDLGNAKSNPLTLAYTSTPYRGLHLLLDIFPEYRRSNPEARLHAYSSMAVYQNHDAYDADMFKWIYDTLRTTDGAEYVGSVPQPTLAERLATSHILAYPNIFPETSCISVMEALAAGMRVVTSNFAALPETTEGFADLVPLDFRDQEGFVRDYKHTLAERPYRIEDEAEALYGQVVHMNQNHTWSVRARQWSEFLN